MSEKKEILQVSDEIENLMRQIRNSRDKSDEFIDEKTKEVNSLEKQIDKLYPSGHPRSVFSQKELQGRPFKWFQFRSYGEILSGSDYFIHPFAGLTLDESLELLKSILKRAKELLIPPEEKLVRITIQDYIFTVRRDWSYEVEVNSPENPSGPSFSERHGSAYVIKHRTIMFVQFCELAPTLFFTPIGDTPNLIRHENLSPADIEALQNAGEHWQRWRAPYYDTHRRIAVRERKEEGSRRRWAVDFSNFSDRFDVGEKLTDARLKRIARKARRYNYNVEEVGI